MCDFPSRWNYSAKPIFTSSKEFQAAAINFFQEFANPASFYDKYLKVKCQCHSVSVGQLRISAQFLKCDPCETMGTSSSTPAAPPPPVVGSGHVETSSTESSGFHIVEFHGTSFSGGAVVLVAFAIICTLFYFCIRYRRRSNRQRQWILEMGGAPEVAQGGGRGRTGRRRSEGDGDVRTNPWARQSRDAEEQAVWGRLQEIVNSGPRGVSYHRTQAPQQPHTRTTTFIDPSKFEEFDEFPLAPVHKRMEFSFDNSRFDDKKFATSGPAFQPIRPAPTIQGAAARAPRKSVPKKSSTDFLPPLVVHEDDGLSDPMWDDPIVRMGDDASNHQPAGSKWGRGKITKESTRTPAPENDFDSGRPLYRPGQDVSSLLQKIA